MADIITDFISIIIEVGIFNAVISFIFGLILLFVASKIAENRVNQYQQAKDTNQIRENLIDLHSRFYACYQYINHHYYEYRTVLKTGRLFQGLEATPNMKRTAYKELVKAEVDFESLSLAWTGRMKTQLKLEGEDKELFKKVSADLKVLRKLVLEFSAKAVIDHKKWEDTSLSLSEGMQKFYYFLLEKPIILRKL